MILFIFLMVGSYVVLSLILGSILGKNMGQRSLVSDTNAWHFFGIGAAKIYLYHFVLGFAWQLLIGLIDEFIISFDMLILSCAVAAIYAAVIWLPAYAFSFWATRRTGQA